MIAALITSAMPLAISSAGKRVEGVQVGHHGGGLLERADQVLAEAMVNRDFAAHAGVGHGE